MNKINNCPYYPCIWACLEMFHIMKPAQIYTYFFKKETLNSSRDSAAGIETGCGLYALGAGV
jgi:hypothetical protein